MRCEIRSSSAAPEYMATCSTSAWRFSLAILIRPLLDDGPPRKEQCFFVAFSVIFILLIGTGRMQMVGRLTCHIWAMISSFNPCLSVSTTGTVSAKPMFMSDQCETVSSERCSMRR